MSSLNDCVLSCIWMMILSWHHRLAPCWGSPGWWEWSHHIRWWCVSSDSQRPKLYVHLRTFWVTNMTDMFVYLRNLMNVLSMSLPSVSVIMIWIKYLNHIPGSGFRPSHSSLQFLLEGNLWLYPNKSYERLNTSSPMIETSDVPSVFLKVFLDINQIKIDN